MKKALMLFCLVFFFALQGKSQSTVVQQIQAQQPGLQLIKFAKTLIGIPYRYASSSPEKGFDCSGFVNYVFENFGFKVPRSSSVFPTAGKPVSLKNAKVGDVLIFTGTNPKIRSIGHVGIVYSIEGDEIKFIHASSGKANGVTITELNTYYKSRFMEAVSII